MPLFSRHPEEHETVPVEPAHVEEPKRHGLFGSREPVEPVQHTVEDDRSSRRHGLFGSRRRSVSPAGSGMTNSTRMTTSTYQTSPSRADSTATNPNRRSLLHRTFGNGNNSADMDPSIVQARERVLSAETAEREADRVLDFARREVREARDQVRKLELEAKEEARLAKIKQYHAKEVSKRGKALGRHDI